MFQTLAATSTVVQNEVVENSICKTFLSFLISDESFHSIVIDLPPGIHSILISGPTQQALQICVDDDVTQENNSKLIDKEVLLNDIQTNGQASNFFEFQEQIQVILFKCSTNSMLRENISLNISELSRKSNSTYL